MSSATHADPSDSPATTPTPLASVGAGKPEPEQEQEVGGPAAAAALGGQPPLRARTLTQGAVVELSEAARTAK